MFIYYFQKQPSPIIEIGSQKTPPPQSSFFKQTTRPLLLSTPHLRYVLVTYKVFIYFWNGSFYLIFKFRRFFFFFFFFIYSLSFILFLCFSWNFFIFFFFFYFFFFIFFFFFSFFFFFFFFFIYSLSFIWFLCFSWNFFLCCLLKTLLLWPLNILLWRHYPLLWHHYPRHYPTTMTSLPYYYDVTTLLLWRHYPTTMTSLTSLPCYYDVTIVTIKHSTVTSLPLIMTSLAIWSFFCNYISSGITPLYYMVFWWHQPFYCDINNHFTITSLNNTSLTIYYEVTNHCH